MPLRQVEAGSEQGCGILFRFHCLPRVWQVQLLPGCVDAFRVGGDPVGKVGEKVGVAGYPVGNNDQRGEEYLHWLRQVDVLPLPQPLSHPAGRGSSVEQFGLDTAPHVFIGGGTQQFAGLGELPQLIVRGWHPVVAARDDRPRKCFALVPTMPFDEPLLEQDLPGQVMGGVLTVRHLLVQRHVQAGAAHGGSQLLDLAGECRSGFPNVVGCGQPHR